MMFNFFRPKKTAPIARDRLKFLIEHKSASGTDTNLLRSLQQEICEVISKHVQIDKDQVRLSIDRQAAVSTLTVDIDLPPATALDKAA